MPGRLFLAERPARCRARSVPRGWPSGPANAIGPMGGRGPARSSRRRSGPPGSFGRRTAERSDGFHRRRPTERPGARHRPRENATFAGPRRRGSVVSPRARSGAGVRGVRRGPSPPGVRGTHASPGAVAVAPSRPVRGSCPPRPDAAAPAPARGPWSRSRWLPVGRGLLRGVFECSGGSARPSSGHRGRRSYEHCRSPPGPWAFRVPQPRQPTSSICHHRTQTNEEGRSTSSGATLFTHVRRRPTLPRGPPRSTIGAEGLNFRVRNGTGCFPFAITAETLLRCHRPSLVKRACWRPYLGNRTVDAKSKRVEAKPLGLLVPVSCTRCRASTSGLSTQWSTGGLTWLTQRETSS